MRRPTTEKDATHHTVQKPSRSARPHACVSPLAVTCSHVQGLSFSSAEISSNGQHALCQLLQQPQRSRASPQRCLHVRTEHRTAAPRAVITCHTRIFSCVHLAHGHSDCFSKFYRPHSKNTQTQHKHVQSMRIFFYMPATSLKQRMSYSTEI